MPSQRRKWMVVLTMFWVVFMAGGSYGAYGVFFNPLLQYLQISRAKLSVLPTIIQVISYGMSPLVGWVLDRVIGRWVVASGLVLVSAGLLLSASAHSYWMLVVASAVFAVGFGMTSAAVVSATLVSNWFETNRGLGMGLCFSGYGIGSSTILQVCGYVIRHFGWRPAYAVLAIPMLMLVPLTLWTLGPPPSHNEHTQHRENLPGLSFAEGIRSRSFWLITIGSFIFSFQGGVLVVHAVPNLIALGVSSVMAVTAVSLGYFLSSFTKPGFGALADKFGSQGTLCFCLCGSAIGCLALIRANHLPLAVVFVLGFALSQAPLALYPMLAAETYSVKSYGTLWGLNITTYVVASMFAPILAGATFDRYASYAPILLVCAIMTLISAFIPFGCVRYEDTAAAQAVKLRQASSAM